VLIAGLTGGLASGKSFVARAFGDLGCEVIEADQLGHEVMAPGGQAYAPVVEAFGGDILSADGRIDRRALAARVFHDPPALERLNAIVHPAVYLSSQERFREIEARRPDAIVIYVAAILIETGQQKRFDKLILVAAPREQQIERALERPGATEVDVLGRIEQQLPLERKVPLADFVIHTGGTKEDTLRQTKIVFEELRKLA
jgi:dephospho-CoA kinase